MVIINFMGTCSSITISELAEKSGRKSSYKHACKMIHKFDYRMYNDLALNLKNPWGYYTNIKIVENKKILHIIHSAVDYLFELQN